MPLPSSKEKHSGGIQNHRSIYFLSFFYIKAPLSEGSWAGYVRERTSLAYPFLGTVPRRECISAVSGYRSGHGPATRGLVPRILCSPPLSGYISGHGPPLASRSPSPCPEPVLIAAFVVLLGARAPARIPLALPVPRSLCSSPLLWYSSGHSAPRSTTEEAFGALLARSVFALCSSACFPSFRGKKQAD